MQVRALATRIQSWTYRIDLPEKQAAAFRAQDALFKDGFGWIHDPAASRDCRVASQAVGCRGFQARRPELRMMAT